MQNHTVAKAGLECKSNGVASEIGLLAYKNPVNLRELFDGVQRSYLVSVWKMERRPQFMEEKTSYELERDKHVAKLEKKLLPIIEAAAELWVFLFHMTVLASGIGRTLSFSMPMVNLDC